MSDIWQASTPRPPAPRGLITAWRASYLLSKTIGQVVGRLYLTNDVTEHALLFTARMSTVRTVLDRPAGVLIVLIIRRITAWQTMKFTQNAA